MASNPDRRDFIKSVAATVSVAAALGPMACWPEATTALDRANLHALAEAALPSSLTRADVDRIVADFRRWLREYRPGAERLHGYGSGEVRYLPENPGPRWAAQLEELDSQSASDRGGLWTDLDVATRQTMLRDKLSSFERGTLGSPIEAEHVAVAVLGRFHGSAEGINLCYRAEINPKLCRPLDEAPKRPVSLPVVP